MATISSLGIGSGLDSESIVTKLVALEKQPLVSLQNKATLQKTQISEFGKIQSQFSALTDAASAMVSTDGWMARKASSSNTSAANISVTAGTSATSFALDVDVLAKFQSITSATLTSGATVGAGTMTLRLGSWTGTTVRANAEATKLAADTALAADPGNAALATAANNAANVLAATAQPAFSPAAGSLDVTVVTDATDTVATLAAKINSLNAGVVATAFNDGTQDRLLLRSKNTGEAAGFRIQTSEIDNTNTDTTGLSRFAYDPAVSSYGMASAGLPMQSGENAKARINGLAVSSSSNILTGNIPGVTITLQATTTSNYNNVGGPEVKAPVNMVVSDDVTPAVKNINTFIEAYNALAKNLADLTRYDANTKTPGLFQGDASILAMQSLLRNMAGSISTGSAYGRLSDVGIERQLNGTLNMNTIKLSTAANNGNELQKLFTADNGNPMTNGFALKFKAFGAGLLASRGGVTNEAASLQKRLDVNTAEQTRVNDRAAAVEKRLRAQYSALDAKMASLSALNSYVSQQVTTWNKSTG